MAREGPQAVWRARLRWRRRGAWRWPAFAGLGVLDALMLGPLPVAGDGTGFLPGLLLATFFNLVGVALVAPFVSRALRRRRPDLPEVVADDRASTAMVVLVTVGLLVAGLAHRPARLAGERAFSVQSAAVRAYVRAHGAPAYRANLAAADSVRRGEGLWRTCVPGDGVEPTDLPLCLLVDTARSPPAVSVDPDRRPNRGR